MKRCPVHGLTHSVQEVHATHHFEDVGGVWKPIPIERKRYFVAREGRAVTYPSRRAAWEAYCPLSAAEDPSLWGGDVA